MKNTEQNRSPQEVFDSHLELRKQGKTEEDIEKNYGEDIIIVSNWGIFHGHKGVRESADILAKHLPDSTFEYDMALTEKETGLLVWSASSPGGSSVKNGVDSFVFSDGKIMIQTIFYALE